MIVNVKKGYEVETVQIDQDCILNILEPEQLPENGDVQQMIAQSLSYPIGSPCLKDIVQKGKTVAILISDMTRPVPSAQILPQVLEQLEKAGIEKEDITIFFAIGSHRKQTPYEQAALVGKEIFHQYRCVDSNIHHTTKIGVTTRGTELYIDSRVVEADYRIAIGNVEFHYFAGFSGGVKALMPGMASPVSIAQNHRLMVDGNAYAGNLDTNPVRLDLEETTRFLSVDFIVNVVLNTHKEIIYVASGDVVQAHRQACAYLGQIYTTPITQKADIVIVSQGGAPKDLNLYQMQKALDNASHAVKDGGTIIMVGSCKEGFGSEPFERWMLQYPDPDEMITALHEHFELGGHKAAAIALVKKKADLYLVSDMDEDIVLQTMLKPYDSLVHAYCDAKEKYSSPTVIIMPYGGSTLPQIH